MKAHPAFLVEDLERMRARVEMSGYKVIESDQFSRVPPVSTCATPSGTASS